MNLDKRLDKLQTDVTFIRSRLDKLEAKAAMIAAIIGSLPGIALIVIELLRGS